MIIDEILDMRDNGQTQGNYMNVEYIFKEAALFSYTDIVKAIKDNSEKQLKVALGKYVEKEYNKDLINFVNKVNWQPGLEMWKKVQDKTKDKDGRSTLCKIR